MNSHGNQFTMGNLWHRMARLTGSLGCSRRLLAAGADASLTDDHGLGPPSSGDGMGHGSWSKLGNRCTAGHKIGIYIYTVYILYI